MLFKNAMYLAWAETKARYRKSALGPLWLVLGNLVGVLGLGLVWAALLKEPFETFVPSLTIGMIIWQLVSGCITDGPTTFVRQASIIRNVSIPLWFFVVRGLSRQIINLIHNMLIVVGVVIYFKFKLSAIFWYAIPGFLLLLINMYWMMFFLGMIGARFRDLEYLLNALMPLLFFISPVIFRPDRLPFDMNLVWMNPFSYFIEIVRAPLLGQMPPAGTYPLMLGLAVGGSSLTYLFYRRHGRRVAFWV